VRSLLAVANVTGWLLVIFAGYFLLPVATGLYYGEMGVAGIFAASGGVTGAAGMALALLTRGSRAQLKPRDGYLLVTVGWLLIVAAAALPLVFSGPGMTFTDAFFEAMSGVTTTGSTVIAGLDHLPHAINLWRHALHWLGGMGIIVLAVAILPLLGVGGMQMYRAESPGPVKDAKLTPRITQSAKLLWTVYAGITLVCVLSLRAAGMDWFDAVCHAFSVMALGGFSTHDASVGWFDSARIEMLLVVFMSLASLNFAAHFNALRRGDPLAYFRDAEARWVLAAFAAGAAVTTLWLLAEGVYDGFWTALRHGLFSTVSVASTTGFATVDWGQWPLFGPVWMLFLSCIACSSGSTGGGIKMFRTLVLIKQSLREMFVLVHPQAVAPLKVAGSVVANRIVYSVLAFIFVYFMSVLVLTFGLLATGLDLPTSLTAILSSINNTGPGLGAVGPASNYAALTDLQTWLCTLAMFLGRMEVFTVLVLLTPTFWRK
jgi:trk system potassium uptake protein TrkH